MSLLSNIVAYWKLDESSGNAHDAVADAYTLTNVGSFSYATAKINNGADFGASNTTKGLNTANDLGINGGAVTMNVWVKINTEIASGTYNMLKCQSGTQDVIQYIDYEYNSGTRRLHWRRFKFVTTVNDFVYNITLGTSNWYMLTYTFDGSDVKGYVNGGYVGHVASSGNGSTALSEYFAIADTNGAYASAIFDECGVWSRALSQDEITSLYNGGAGLQYPFLPANKGFLNFFK